MSVKNAVGRTLTVFLQEARYAGRSKEADGEYVTTQLADARVVLFHLPEVRPARDSGEMAQEDKKQRTDAKF